jgi:hypothetical protein
MPLDSRQLAQAAVDLKRHVLEEIAGDPAAPAHTAAVARLLMEKPWVPGFLMPLISPLRSAMRSYLKMSVVRVEARVWYFPSFHWWRNHARTLHGDDGSACDVSAHVAALTEGSPDALFKAADLLEDGSVKVLGAPDFAAEALHWDENYRIIETR